MHRLGSIAARLAALAVAVVLGGCTTLAGLAAGPGTVVPPQGGDPIPLNATTGQVVMRGNVVDGSGQPVGGAYLFLVLQPSSAQMAQIKVGDALPETPITAVTAAADGTFAITLGPDDRVRAVAKDNGDYANFQVYAFATWPGGDGSRMGMWGAPLHVTEAGYDELPEPFTIQLSG